MLRWTGRLAAVTAALLAGVVIAPWLQKPEAAAPAVSASTPPASGQVQARLAAADIPPVPVLPALPPAASRASASRSAPAPPAPPAPPPARPAVAGPAPAASAGAASEAFQPEEVARDVPRITLMEAIVTTLALSPQIKIQETQVEDQRGVYTQERGAFDTSVVARFAREERNPQGLPGANNEGLLFNQYLTQWELGLRRQFRNGILFEPHVRVGMTEDTSLGENFNFNQAEVGFAVVIPLAKGLGEAQTAAAERASRIDYQASILALRHVTAQSVAATMTAYWQCRAAEERYDLLRRSEEVAGNLVTISRALVDGDELAPSQLSQILADEATATSQRIASEQSLIQLRQRLALAMGYPPHELARAPLAKDSFPIPPPERRVPAASFRELSRVAVDLRDDLRAARQLAVSRKILMDASRLNLRPRIDLRVDAGFAGIRPGAEWPDLADALGADLQGPSWKAAVAMDWPLANDLAEGRYISDTAVYARSQIQASDLERTIVSGVISVLTALRGTGAQLDQLRLASELNASALDTQQQLFRLGLSSLTDTITLRLRLIDSELAYVDVKERYAINLAQLRFQTGTLLPAQGSATRIGPEIGRLPPFVP